MSVFDLQFKHQHTFLEETGYSFCFSHTTTWTLVISYLTDPRKRVQQELEALYA